MRKKNISTPIYLLFSVVYLRFSTAVEPPSPPQFLPVEHITLGCGSDNNTIGIDGRTWISDTSSKVQLLDETKSSVSSSVPLPTEILIDSGPFIKARVSRSQFTYIFSVAAGPKFIRLYFFPASYPGGFGDSDASFSVVASGFTLVNNFNPANHARSIEMRAFYKEFCLNVQDGQNLNLTFTPTPGVANAYALINAIEILSMPTNLYYTKESDPGIVLLGLSGIQRQIDSNTGLELMYRLNVGGKALMPSEDTGMFRNWENDERYLTIDVSSVQPANATIDLQFTKIENYTAPKTVYRTARSMGMDKTINDNYYLTWEFPVDPTFTYFLRLHFCEFQPPIQVQGDRDFQIFISDIKAEAHADVIYWSGGNGVPVYRDYGVIVAAEANKKMQNISIALHTNSWRETSYSDAILNGIEIFKLSSDSNLAGTKS